MIVIYITTCIRLYMFCYLTVQPQYNCLFRFLTSRETSIAWSKSLGCFGLCRVWPTARQKQFGDSTLGQRWSGVYICRIAPDVWSVHSRCAVQSQNAVSAYFTIKQIGLLPFGFAEQTDHM